ncbi:MAG TPA: hypothetical protein VH761_10215 [Ilumatobacteraceae bacterium]|jgi:predicted metal-dependent HD superfamily phosphohydrolase
MTQPEVEIRRAWRHAAGVDHDRLIDGLLLRYREPHRRYHTATHIMMVVRHVHEVAAALARQPSPQLIVAALYHDAIYDPRAADNEARSAELADRDLREVGWSGEQRGAVTTMIAATATHVTDDSGEQTAILLDADLAILGAEPRAYQAYVTGVRAEYSFVGDHQWREGRGRVLQSFLDRQRIFVTEPMRATREHRARANIEAELATLR